jgi:hypothetical protein
MKKKPTILALVVAVASLMSARPARADVRVTMHDGLVTIVAKDATVRQILAEWARIGQATIVNADRIAGGPITLELSDVPERQALDILLRSVSGYFVAPRPTRLPEAAQFDRIVVLPAVAQPRSASVSAPPPPLTPPTRFQLPPATPDTDDFSGPPPIDPTQRLPVVNQFSPPFPPPPADAGRGAPAPTTAAPAGPVGTSAPGMVLPAPATPQVPPPVSGPGR